MMTWRALPNILTGSRIGLSVAVFLALAVSAVHAGAGRQADAVHPLLLFAFGAFTVGALTDFFDGWLARRLNAQSVWGAILDPIADKLAVLAAILGLLLLEPRLGLALPGFAILFREVFISGLRETGASRGLSFPVTYLAKWKTTIQLVALALEILSAAIGLNGLSMASDALLWIAVALTLWTGGQYVFAAARQL